jgi:hypothetical protein
MLHTFTADTFRPRIGEEFRVVVDDRHYMPTRLADVTEWGAGPHAPEGSRTPFTLTFRAAPGMLVPQRIYPVLNENMPPCEMFLVPLGPDSDGMRYEAVFT